MCTDRVIRRMYWVTLGYSTVTRFGKTPGTKRGPRKGLYMKTLRRTQVTSPGSSLFISESQFVQTFHNYICQFILKVYSEKKVSKEVYSKNLIN